MNKFIILLFLSSLIGCGREVIRGPMGPQGPAGPKGDRGTDGNSCHVEQTSSGATILCDDGSSATITNGMPGAEGPIGPQGPQGEPGLPGTSCSVISISNGATISCTDGTIVSVYNGTNGLNGTNGTNGSVITPIELCPNLSGGYFHEYLLKIDGNLFAVYASGSNIGYTKLWPGSWVTTDGRSCHFTVNSNMNVLFN